MDSWTLNKIYSLNSIIKTLVQEVSYLLDITLKYKHKLMLFFSE